MESVLSDDFLLHFLSVGACILRQSIQSFLFETKSFMLRLHRATFSLRPYYVLKNKDVVRTWYGLVGRGRNVVRT